MADHALMQLSGLTRPTSAVRDELVIKDQQVAWVQAHFLLDATERDAAVGEERDLLGQAGELQPATEPRGGLDAGQYGRIADRVFVGSILSKDVFG